MSETSTKILFVDDDPNLLDGLRRQFRRDFDMTVCDDAVQALELIRRSEPFAVIVADYNMPRMDGVEFLTRAHESSPDTVALMLTGQSELAVAIDALHQGNIFRFLQKPCPPDVLRRAVRDGLEQYRLITAERRLTAQLAEANGKLQAVNDDLEAIVLSRTAIIRRLHEFVTGLNGRENIEEVGDLVVKTAAELLQSERIGLFVPRGDREHLSLLAAVGIPRHVVATTQVPVGSGLVGQVFAHGEGIVANSPDELPGGGPDPYAEQYAIPPVAAALLVSPTGPVGVLTVSGHAGEAPYGPDDLAHLRAVAEAASIAINNQLRLEERNEARDAIILALAKLAERRDPETGQHLDRVRIYCRMLSTTLAATGNYPEITRSFIDSIYRSSPLHDIGKVGIPDAILLKPDRLTPGEYEIMKQHAVIGGDTIRAVIEKGRSQDFLRIGMEIAYGHHEKYDGTGYPNGLRGEQIPLSARIMAVADVYDALTSRRVYKPAFPHEKAVKIIREDAGKHFDPAVVEAFLQNEAHFANLAAEMADHVPEPQAADAQPADAPADANSTAASSADAQPAQSQTIRSRADQPQPAELAVAATADS